jgi:hypothetical protein
LRRSLISAPTIAPRRLRGVDGTEDWPPATELPPTEIWPSLDIVETSRGAFTFPPATINTSYPNRWASIGFSLTIRLNEVGVGFAGRCFEVAGFPALVIHSEQ